MSQQELSQRPEEVISQKSEEGVCEKKEKKITTLPAKYLRYMSFAHWFLKELKLEDEVYNDLISRIPQDISQQISFLNPFIDFESLHQKQFKTFVKDRNAQLKAQHIAHTKALKANAKAQLKALKSFLSTLNNDPQAKNIFSSNHPHLIPLLNTHKWKPHHDLLLPLLPFINQESQNENVTTEQKEELSIDTNVIENNPKSLIDTNIITIDEKKYLLDNKNNDVYDIDTHKVIGKYESDRLEII